MNRSIWLSILSIFAVVALVGGLTLAYFSDAGTSNNNVFAAGTLDLALSDDPPETDQDNVTASFGGSNLGPGACTGTSQLRVKNLGNINGDHIEIAVINNVTDVGVDSAPDMDAFLRLAVFNYDDTPISIPNSNGNGIFDLDDLEINGVDNLALTNTGSNHRIDLKVCLDGSAGNPLQGDSVDSDWTITLNQHSSQ